VRGPLIFALIRRSERFSIFLADYTSHSPGLVGLESDRLLLLGAESVSALVLGFWLEDDFEDWGRCGADFVRVRGF
jgi:hypothetical protein